MDEKLLSKMEKGEEILWRGKSSDFVVLDKTHAPHFWKELVITVVALAAIIVAYFMIAARNHIDVKMGLIYFFVAAAAFIIVSPFLNASKIKKKEYVITDRQIFVLTDEARSVGYDKIPAARFATDEDGHVSLVCGSDADGVKNKSLRTYAALDPHINFDTALCEHFVIYALDGEADKVKEIVQKFVPVK